MEDVLSRPRVFRALVELRKAHPRPLTAGGFEVACGYEFVAAHKLRLDLLEWGLIEVDETFRGKLPVTLHRLTPQGHAVAELALQAEAVAMATRDEVSKAVRSS